MARLTGQAALEWLKANPNAAYETINPETGRASSYSGGSSGFIGDLLGGIGGALLNPIIGTAEQVNQAALAARGQQNYQPQFMSEQEWDQYVQNPLGKNLQNAASVASFAAPGVGSGLTRLATAGLAGGVLQGFAGQDLREGLDVGNVAQNALLGGAFAGGAGLIGKGIGKLASRTPVEETVAASFPKNMQEFKAVVKSQPREVLDDVAKRLGGEPVIPDPKTLLQKMTQKGLEMEAQSAGYTLKPGPNAVTNYYGAIERGKQLTKLFGENFDEKGILRTAEKATNVLDNATDLATKQGVVVSAAEGLLDPDSITLLANELGQSVPATQRLITTRLRQLGKEGGGSTLVARGGKLVEDIGDVSPRQILDIKRSTYQGSSAYEKASRSGTGTPSARLALDKYINDWSKGALEESVPGARVINRASAEIAEYSPNFARAYNTGQGGFQTASPQSISKAVIMKGGREIGKVLQGEIPGKSLPGRILSSQPVDRLLKSGATQKVTNLLQNPTAQRMSIVGLLGDQPQSTDDGMSVQDIGMGSMDDMGIMGGIGMPQSGQIQEQRQQLAMQLLSSGVKPSDAKTVLELLMGSEPTTTATERKTLRELDNAEGNLQLLAQTVDDYENRFSPIFGQGVFGLPGQILDPERNRAETRIKALVQTIAKSLEGGRLTDADREYYNTFTPALSDTPEAARQKIAALMDVLREKQLAYQ